MKGEKLKEREMIIKLSNKRKSIREISSLLDISKSRVGYWVKRHKESGLLIDKPRSGRPSRLTKSEMEKLKVSLHEEAPKNYGGKSMGWKTKHVIRYIKEEFNVIYSVRAVEKIIHKCGLSLITPRTEHIKGSEAARIVYRMDFKKNSNRNIWIAPSLISTK